MPTVAVKFRRANPVDKGAIQRISADAYVPAYMAVLGTIPKPATEDYGIRIEKGEVWILEVEGRANRGRCPRRNGRSSADLQHSREAGCTKKGLWGGIA
jgi:hypothetical protein